MSQDLFLNALSAAGIRGMPLWDAQIFVAAKLHGATTILSEDFQHGRTTEGVTFLNPFAKDFDIAKVLKPD